MKKKIIDAKCPYCKTEFSTSTYYSSRWATILWDDRSSTFVTHTCPQCQKKCVVTATQTVRYTARKLKEPT